MVVCTYVSAPGVAGDQYLWSGCGEVGVARVSVEVVLDSRLQVSSVGSLEAVGEGSP